MTTRKKNRLEHYDYSRCGAYFITVCTKNKHNCFWEDVGAIIDRPEHIPLSSCGLVVRNAIEAIPRIYPAISIDRYVIMPNHIHLLLVIHADEDGRPMVAPTIARIIKQWKGAVSKQIGSTIWQKSYYDHIIRNQQDYEQHAKYIDENPIRWCDDELYIRFL